MGVTISRAIRSQRKKQNPTSLIPPAQRNFYNRFCPELKTHSERPQAPIPLRGRLREHHENFFCAPHGNASKPPLKPTPGNGSAGATRAYPPNRHCQCEKVFYATRTPNHQVNDSVSC